MGGGKTPSDVIESLKKSKLHNDVMLNKGMWEKFEWNSVGAALLHDGKKHYGPLWFAKEKDSTTC